jgi:hypothetical protein
MGGARLVHALFTARPTIFTRSSRHQGTPRPFAAGLRGSPLPLVTAREPGCRRRRGRAYRAGSGGPGPAVRTGRRREENARRARRRGGATSAGLRLGRRAAARGRPAHAGAAVRGGCRRRGRVLRPGRPAWPGAGTPSMKATASGTRVAANRRCPGAPLARSRGRSGGKLAARQHRLEPRSEGRDRRFLGVPRGDLGQCPQPGQRSR